MRTIKFKRTMKFKGTMLIQEHAFHTSKLNLRKPPHPPKDILYRVNYSFIPMGKINTNIKSQTFIGHAKQCVHQGVTYSIQRSIVLDVLNKSQSKQLKSWS